MADARTAEEQFYSSYSWCLNPALSIEDLLRRFREEVDRYETLAGWQREESKTNLYLFVCGIACTADDYFALPFVNLSPLSNRYPKFRSSIETAQMLIDASRSIMRIRGRAAWSWRRGWDNCVAQACRLLLSDSASEFQEFQNLRSLAAEFTGAQLPGPLLKRRMRLPEAFRSQDMAHHDVISLIRHFCDSSCSPDRQTVVIGLRTAGAYFAPLMAEYLKLENRHNVSWFSIRPKSGVAQWEEQQLRSAAKDNARVLIVDDYPATGGTLRIALEILARCAIPPEQIVILAPTHPAQPNWVQLAGVDERIAVFTIHSSDLYKNTLFTANHVEPLCKGYYEKAGWEETRVLPDDQVRQINSRLSRHSKDGHHVREKRVFALQLSAAGGKAAKTKVIFKSVGWGWLGYHAFIAGMRLQNFVPRVLGLRNGLLLSEWVQSGVSDPLRSGCAAGAVPLTEGDNAAAHPSTEGDNAAAHPSFEAAKVIGSYVAARSRRLSLTGDCRLENRTYRWTGADEILEIIRAVYGRYLNRLKVPALRKELYKYVTAVPTLIDGKMCPDEWVHAHDDVYKADFEHHNFGGSEPDIVDPAYDLAAATFEFGLSREDEEELLRVYQQESGDTSIAERILLYKILYGRTVMRHSLENIASSKQPETNNARCQQARNFLVYAMNDFCAKLMGAAAPSQWSDALFFLDLDGVFDQELLGFPHATYSGLQSLALLQAAGFSVVPNTGRSVQHVRQYCDAYGLPGGVAEFGAVFVDAVQKREVPLIDNRGAEQLARCREAIKTLPGVFIDPSYEYSIRAFRFRPRGTVGLEPAELKKFLKRPEFSHLTSICRGPDSYIVQKHTNKGAALRFVRRQVGGASTPVTAVGDSKYDLAMLKAAEFAYAPANCSPLVRALAKTGECRIVRQRFQNGLLAAVRHRLRRQSARQAAQALQLPARGNQLNGLMQSVLRAADRQVVLQIIVILSWWDL